MVDHLLLWDRKLFVYLNGLGSEKYDGLWLFITSQVNWIPIFLLIGYLVFKHLGWRHAVMILIIIAALIALTDQTTNLFKYGFQRLRLGNEPELAHLIRAIQTRKSFSFISGHASNSMASAVFLYLVLKPYLKYMGFIFLWPLIFAYSRIYLGLHYPLDIICGYIWGIMMAFIMWEVYKISRDKFFPKQKEHLDNPTNA
ncbi:MAG TPA: phosphatase PAP2 family protein [Flavobacterium sp.]|nr:phosphatase PAP2 family protein [Flavobacterium sp.]